MKKRVLIKGPFLSQSGYGEQARYLFESLKNREDIDLFVENTNWGSTSWIVDKRKDEIEELIKKAIHYAEIGGTFDLFVQVSIPNEIEKKAPVNILYTAGIESTLVPPEWLEKVNQIDKVIVVSNHAKYGFDNSQYKIYNKETQQQVGVLSCEVPVEVQNYAAEDKITSKSVKLDLEFPFNFLCVGQWSPRKNIEPMIVWFMEEFKDKPVGLVLKTSTRKNCILDRDYTEKKLRHLIKNHTDENAKCKVYLLHGNMSEDEIYGLYKNKKIKALVSNACGEGFGLPIFEAAQSNLPVIAPDWSGYLDFMVHDGKKYFTDIDYDIRKIQPEAVWKGVLQEDSMWAFTKEKSFKKSLRNVYENLKEKEDKAKELSSLIKKKFNKQEMYDSFYEKVVGSLDVSDDEIQSWLDEIKIYD
jgi:glycosyltransferase involved in cell wall biosynthesis